MSRIVLASRSPRRKQLLEWAELDFDVMVRETDETWPEGLPIEEVPVHIARHKALAVRNSSAFERYENGALVIAADTIVLLDREIIGKPETDDDAIQMLERLSGKRHRVITGVVIQSGEKEISFSDITKVWFHEISTEQIRYYVEKYKPLDKAGAYAIQEWIGVVGIKRIEGDFYNVMGLPVSRVIRALETI